MTGSLSDKALKCNKSRLEREAIITKKVTMYQYMENARN